MKKKRNKSSNSKHSNKYKRDKLPKKNKECREIQYYYYSSKGKIFQLVYSYLKENYLLKEGEETINKNYKY